MARPLRIEYSSAHYHVVNRGNNQECGRKRVTGLFCNKGKLPVEPDEAPRIHARIEDGLFCEQGN